MRRPITDGFFNQCILTGIGLSRKVIDQAIMRTYRLLDRIDHALKDEDVPPLSMTVELANLSSMIGNIFASELANCSDGVLKRNGPHKYPDLLSTSKNAATPHIELKIALEANNPKGHLAKPGWHIIVRYVLCDNSGSLRYKAKHSERGTVPYIWEVRVGHLEVEHFNISNTSGDSGKTAVVNAAGMARLAVIYFDRSRAPIPQTGSRWAFYKNLCA